MHHQHHGHHRIRNAEQDHDDPMVVSVVYVTASKTFDGPIGGYKTLDGSGDANTALPDPEKDSPEPLTSEPAQATPAAHPALTQEPSSNKDTSVEQHTQATPSLETAKDESTTAEATAPAPTSSPSFSTKVTSKSSKTPEKDAFAAKSETAGAHQTQSAAYSFVEQPAASSTSSSSPSALAASNSQGMTAGAKAGLAIGIIAVIGALCLFALCLIRIKRKKSKKVDNEKVPNNVQDSVARAPSTRSTRTDATAPRLSLRPVTQFLPDLGPRGKNGNMVAAAGGPAQNTLNVPNENFSEKNEHQRQGDVANPFGQHAEVSDGIVLPIQTNKPTNPFGNHAVASVDPSGSAIPAPLRVRTPTPEATGINKTGAAALMGGPREDRYKAPNQLNVGGPPRPASPALSVAGTEFSMSSVSPGAPYTSNVHRIQLDFKPSMDDELGLKAGQLVRLLHEYDDGWVSFCTSLAVNSVC